MSTSEPGQRSQPPGLTWSWGHALVGAVYAIPAAVVAMIDPALGVPLAVGVLPAAIIGIPARRRERIRILLIGTLAGASVFVGGLLSHLPMPATAVLLAATVAAAALTASMASAGRVVLALCAPMVGVGLSYGDYAESIATFALLTAGAAFAWVVALCWPERAAPERPQTPLPPRHAMLGYGARMGVAAALTYAIAASLGLDHPGWAPAACLLVARPQLDLLQQRGVARVLSVTVGALAAVLLLWLQPSNATLALVCVAMLGAIAGTAGSRWYITSAFTTLLVFVMLLNGHTDETVAKVNERVGETVLGVAAAYLFGWAIPVLRSRLTRQTGEPTG